MHRGQSLTDIYQKEKDGYILVIYKNGTSSFICLLLDTESSKGDIFLGEYEDSVLYLLKKTCDKYIGG